MVTQQILVLSFLVRIQVAQPENRRTFAVLLFFVFKVLKVLNDLKDFKDLLPRENAKEITLIADAEKQNNRLLFKNRLLVNSPGLECRTKCVIIDRVPLSRLRGAE